jgi:hypothetical protein
MKTFIGIVLFIGIMNSIRKSIVRKRLRNIYNERLAKYSELTRIVKK